MTDPRPSWDEYGLHIARAASMRADCTRRLVGAALLGADHRVLALGYNGAPSGVPGCLSAGACPRGQFTYAEIPPSLGNDGHAVRCIALHAEENCLRHFEATYAPWSRPAALQGASLYITDDPCPGCAALLDDFPLLRVVTPSGVWRSPLP